MSDCEEYIFVFFVYISCVAVLARGVESSLFFSSIVVGESCIILRLFFLEYNKRFQLKVKIFCLWTCRVDFEIFFIFVFQRVRTEIRVFYVNILWMRTLSGFKWHWKWRLFQQSRRAKNSHKEGKGDHKSLFAFII